MTEKHTCEFMVKEPSHNLILQSVRDIFDNKLLTPEEKIIIENILEDLIDGICFDKEVRYVYFAEYNQNLCTIVYTRMTNTKVRLLFCYDRNIIMQVSTHKQPDRQHLIQHINNINKYKIYTDDDNKNVSKLKNGSYMKFGQSSITHYNDTSDAMYEVSVTGGVIKNIYRNMNEDIKGLLISNYMKNNGYTDYDLSVETYVYPTNIDLGCDTKHIVIVQKNTISSLHYFFSEVFILHFNEETHIATVLQRYLFDNFKNRLYFNGFSDPDNLKYIISSSCPTNSHELINDEIRVIYTCDKLESMVPHNVDYRMYTYPGEYSIHLPLSAMKFESDGNMYLHRFYPSEHDFLCYNPCCPQSGISCDVCHKELFKYNEELSYEENMKKTIHIVTCNLCKITGISYDICHDCSENRKGRKFMREHIIQQHNIKDIKIKLKDYFVTTDSYKMYIENDGGVRETEPVDIMSTETYTIMKMLMSTDVLE